MGDEKKRVYKRRRPVKAALTALAAVLAALILLAVLLFFGLQKYIVYTPEGVRLELPFLAEYRINEGSQGT